MKVEIINHDHTCVMLDLEAVPRAGETVLVKINDSDTIEGVVDRVDHWLFKEDPTKNQVTVYLKPSDYK